MRSIFLTTFLLTGCLGPVPAPEIPDADLGTQEDAGPDLSPATSSPDRPPLPPLPDGGSTSSDARSTTTTPSRDGGAETPAVSDSTQSPSPLFGFENASPDWLSNESVLTRDTGQFKEGAASLMFVSKGYVKVTSRAFDTSAELSNVTGRFSLDVYLTFPEGQINLYFECNSAKVGTTHLGNRNLAGFPLERWNTLYFEIPARVVTALKAPANGCKIWFDHNGQGVTRYDRLTFVP